MSEEDKIKELMDKVEKIEEDFFVVRENGEVISKDGYHQPDKRSGYYCGCENTTSKGAYRDVVIDYDGFRYYFYHQTAVVVKLSSHEYWINNGGYKTKTTKERISGYLPKEYRLRQVDYDWYVDTPDGKVDFERRMVIDTLNSEVISQ